MNSSSFSRQTKRAHCPQKWARDALSTVALVCLTTATAAVVQAEPVVVPPDISSFVDAVNAADAAKRASSSVLNSNPNQQVTDTTSNTDITSTITLGMSSGIAAGVGLTSSLMSGNATSMYSAVVANKDVSASFNAALESVTQVIGAYAGNHAGNYAFNMTNVSGMVPGLSGMPGAAVHGAGAEVVQGIDLIFNQGLSPNIRGVVGDMQVQGGKHLLDYPLASPSAYSLAYRLPINHPRIEGKTAVAFNESSVRFDSYLRTPYKNVKGGLLEDIKDAGSDLTLDEALGIYDDDGVVTAVVHNFSDLPYGKQHSTQLLPWMASLAGNTNGVGVWDEINASPDGKINLAHNRVIEACLAQAKSVVQVDAQAASKSEALSGESSAVLADAQSAKSMAQSITDNVVADDGAAGTAGAGAGALADGRNVHEVFTDLQEQKISSLSFGSLNTGVGSEVGMVVPVNSPQVSAPRPAPSFFEAVPVTAQNINQGTPQIAAYRTGDTARTEAAAQLVSAMANGANSAGALTKANALAAPSALSAAAQAGATGNALHMRLSQVQVTPDSGLAWDAKGALGGLIGQEIDAHLLQRVLNQLSRYYRDLGYTNAQAYLPEQSILDGKLDVYVATTKLQDVVLENNTAVSDDYFDYLLSGVKEQYGQPINQAELESQLLKLSDLGVFNLVGGFSALDATGLYADLELRAEPSSDRWTFEVFADNYGNESSGRYRFGGHLIVKSPFGIADRLSLFYARTDEQQNNYSLNYEAPINSHPTVLGVNFCYSNYELGQEYEVLGAQGHAYTIEGYVREPLFRDADNKLDLQVGMRYRKLVDEFRNFDLEFRKHSLAAYTSLSTVNALNVDTSVYGQAKFTMGRLYMDDAYELMPEDTYYLLNLDAGVMHRFNSNLFWQTSLQAQMASTALEGSEQFLAGGPQGISALGSSDLVGDSGLVLRNELIFQPFESTSNFVLNMGPHIEAASVSSKGYTSDSAASAGFQVELWTYGLNASLDLSTILGSKPDFVEDDARIMFSVSYTF